MKFIHVSDLHIGKKLKEMSLEEDQRYILRRICEIVDEEAPFGVIIAGDVYDTTSPTRESVAMLDDFLTALSRKGVRTFVISGNHDPPEKLGFGSRMMESSNMFICGSYTGGMDVHTFEEGGVKVQVCLLPFIRPVLARRYHPDERIDDYTDAVRASLDVGGLDPSSKKVLVTHQFVVCRGVEPERSESESVFVGGTEAVDSSVFDGFDYVALGHIHKPQNVGKGTIRYSGTPLKYSVSECDQVKSVTVVDIGDEVAVSTIPLEPLHGMRRLHGPLDKLVEAGKGDRDRDDFIFVRLTEESFDALPRLREVYPNVMSIEVDGKDEQMPVQLSDPGPVGRLDMRKAFADFYRSKTGEDLTETQMTIVSELMGESE